MRSDDDIMTFEIPFDGFSNFLVENRCLIINEIVTAIEYMLYNNIDSINICKLEIVYPFSRVMMNCNVGRETNISYGLHSLLEWTNAHEEYELSHRIKLIQQHISNYKK
jgi:hypothetical protein